MKPNYTGKLLSRSISWKVLLLRDCGNGQFPRHQGFVLRPDEAAALIAKDPANREIVHPFLIGAEMLTHGAPQRWVIDFQKMGMLDARRYDAPFRHVEANVLPHIQELVTKEQENTGK